MVSHDYQWLRVSSPYQMFIYKNQWWSRNWNTTCIPAPWNVTICYIKFMPFKIWWKLWNSVVAPVLTNYQFCAVFDCMGCPKIKSLKDIQKHLKFKEDPMIKFTYDFKFWSHVCTRIWRSKKIFKKFNFFKNKIDFVDFFLCSKNIF